MSAPENDPKSPSSGRETYNTITDVVAGPNIRMKDNLLQGLAILVCAAAGVVIGHFYVILEDWNGALMVYRGFRHFRGKHD